MNNLYLFRLKLILRDRINCIVLFLSLLIFLFLMNSLSFASQERSSIPIGLLNLDNGEYSEQLVKRLKQVPSLYVYEADIIDLNKLLYDEQISAIFVIEEGYDLAIQKEKLKDIVTLYHLQDNKSAKIISDIFAGEMLYDICLYKGFNLYEATLYSQRKQDINKNIVNDYTIFSKEDYIKYGQSLINSQDFDFAFDISLMNVDMETASSDKINNALIYQQVIMGIFQMLLAFIAMFMVSSKVQEIEARLDKRIKITMYKPIIVDISHLGAMLTILSLYALLLSVAIGKNIKNFATYQSIAMFILLLFFSVVMGLWFLLLSKVLRKIIPYQIISAFSILIFGFFGFLYSLEGFLNNKLIIISKIIPNSWFMKGFTDIIVSKSLQDMPFIAYYLLLIMAIVLYIINNLIERNLNR